MDNEYFDLAADLMAELAQKCSRGTSGNVPQAGPVTLCEYEYEDGTILKLVLVLKQYNTIDGIDYVVRYIPAAVSDLLGDYCIGDGGEWVLSNLDVDELAHVLKVLDEKYSAEELWRIYL